MPSTPRAADRSKALPCPLGFSAWAGGARGCLVFLAVVASACGPRATKGPDTPPRNAGRTLGAVFQTLDNPFFREVDAGIREIVESNGDSLVTLAADWSGTRQQDDVHQFTNRRVAALFVNPVDPRAIENNLHEANEAGIPCIVVDTQMPRRDAVACQVLSDNREAGRLAARSLAQARRSGKLVILDIPANEACSDRISGFREIIDRFADIEIVAVEDGGGTRAAARAAMESLLRRFPHLDGVFAANDPMALGAAEALEGAGRLADVVVTSVDGSPEGIAAVHADRLRSTSMQFPREIGRIAAQRAYELLNGNSVENEIRVPVELVTKDNAHAFISPGS
jgi:ribose transport system substrate-binding protein